MKSTKTMMVRVLCLVLAASAGTVLAGTNVWKGPSSGGLWSDQANWTEPLTPTVSTVYDFSALADGAVVTNPYEYSASVKQLQIGGLVFGENQGRVTLAGTDTSQTIVSSGTFLVPTGTTLVIALRHTTEPWQDYASGIVLSGGGEIVFEGNGFKGTSWTYYFADATGMRVSLGSKTAFQLCSFAFYSPSPNYTAANDVRLQLTADTLVAGIKGNYVSSVKNFIDQGEYDLCIGYFESAESYEATTGTGRLTYEGGGTYTLRAAPRNTGGVTVRNADVKLGRVYWRGSPKTSTAGPVQVPEETDFDLENSGKVSTYCDQVFNTLRGEGTWGSINMVSNYDGLANLVVGRSTSSGETVFNGRLTGLGGLVKQGSDYTFVMTGANDYDGKTEVKEGSLVLRRAADPESAPAVHFDFANAANWTTSVGGAAAETAMNGVSRVATGLSGCGAGALDFDPEGGSVTPYFTYKLAADVAPVCEGNRRFTEIVWIRPRWEGCHGEREKQPYILSNGSTWGSARNWVRVYLTLSTNFNFTVCGYTWGDPTGEDGFCAKVGKDELYDGRWHQVALTWGEGNVLSGYFDGRLLGSTTVPAGLALPKNCSYNLGINSGNEKFDGGMDEVKLFRRALTAEEIRAEYARTSVVLEVGEEMPAPVACWKFNGADPGTDSSANGYDLSAASGTPSTIDTFPGVFGKSLSTASGLKWAGASFPAKIPVGNAPFTVSCRYKYYNTWSSSPLVVWGDPQKANAFFLMGTDESERRRPMINYNTANSTSVRSCCAYTNLVHSSIGSSSEANWTHLVCTYDGSTIRMYQDGHLAHAPLKDVALDIAADRIYIGCLPEVGAVFNGTIDDVRIFDRTLTADQVRSLTRSLATDDDPPVLPADAQVTVAADATLGIEGTSPTFASLACAGTLELGRYGAYCLNAGDILTGSLAGIGRLDVSDRDLSLAGGSGFAGTLVASNAAISVSGGLGSACVNLLGGASLVGAGAADVSLADGAVIDVDVSLSGSAGLATTGEVTLADKVVVRFSAVPELGVVKVVSAGSLRAPTSLAGWTAVGSDGRPLEGVKVKFMRSGNEILGKVSGGLVILLK